MTAPNQSLNPPKSPAYSGQVLLFWLPLANFAITTDQQMSRVFSGTTYLPTAIVALRRSGGASVTCAGGIYDAASKGGTAIVAAAQNWVTLAAGIVVQATLALPNNVFGNTPFLSLTTGSTAAITADVLIYGYDLT
jgi:hypothetical protein